MNESECLSKMISPGMIRPGIVRGYYGGIMQVWLTRSCDLACFGCTQGSNLRGNPGMMTPFQFERVMQSVQDYFGVVALFGGNPARNIYFEEICEIMRRYIPHERRGIWCNNPLGKGKTMRETFNAGVSNLNVHLKQEAYDEFLRDWPECRPALCGLDKDSRHSPVFVSMKDIGIPEEERWELISKCSINQNWSAMVCVVRGELRGYFCEVAGSQAMLHQDDKEWLDHGLPLDKGWWRQSMQAFAPQVRQACHHCGVPLKGHGELAQSKTGVEQTSEIHKNIYKPRVKDREVQVVQIRDQLGNPLDNPTKYLQNSTL